MRSQHVTPTATTRTELKISMTEKKERRELRRKEMLAIMTAGWRRMRGPGVIAYYLRHPQSPMQDNDCRVHPQHCPS